MTYRFLEEAAIEFDHAIGWYESQQAALGHRFLTEVYSAIQKIVDSPHSFPRAKRVKAEREVRMTTIHRFEYLLVYEVLPNEVVIMSVVHARRSFQPWRRRL